MPKQLIRETIPGSSEIVFSVVHDYSRRLEWDTLLQRAEIEDDVDKAGLGAVTMCQAKAFLGGIKMRTKYVSFQPGKVAAVKLLNHPIFFETFVASIRHFEKGGNWSEVIYEYNFRSRPALLRPLLEPVMALCLNCETRKRLRSLRNYIENGMRI